MNNRPVVLITGGARRIGAALCVYFARRGYDVALHCHRSQAEAAQVKADVEKLGIACDIFTGDLGDIAALPGLISQVMAWFGRCDVLVNNASVFERAEFLETDEALFDRQFTVNFKAPFFLTQAFARQCRKGSVINLLDTDIAQNQISHFAYLLSKKTFADFTLMAARALGPDIRVNGVCPGVMLPSEQVEADFAQKIAPQLPLKSHPDLESLCEAVHWLSAQTHITGQILYVDGGKHVL